jgi:hypothetical protein
MQRREFIRWGGSRAEGLGQGAWIFTQRLMGAADEPALQARPTRIVTP